MADGATRIGRPKQTWIEAVNKDMCVVNVMKEVTVNRAERRKLFPVACFFVDLS